jgi:hypothetical protein
LIFPRTKTAIKIRVKRINPELIQIILNAAGMGKKKKNIHPTNGLKGHCYMVIPSREVVFRGK